MTHGPINLRLGRSLEKHDCCIIEAKSTNLSGRDKKKAKNSTGTKKNIF